MIKFAIIALTLAALSLVFRGWLNPPAYQVEISERCRVACAGCQAKMIAQSPSPAGPVEEWACQKRHSVAGWVRTIKPMIYVRHRLPIEKEKYPLIWERM